MCNPRESEKALESSKSRVCVYFFLGGAFALWPNSSCVILLLLTKMLCLWKFRDKSWYPPERERLPGVDLARELALFGFSGTEARGLGRSVRDAAARRHVSDLEVLPDGP